MAGAVKKVFLSDMKQRQKALIVSIQGGNTAAKRLTELGLAPDTEVEVLNKAPFSGPLEIGIEGSRLILGRKLASKIVVVPK